jgi:excisionase family DNA binding protein
VAGLSGSIKDRLAGVEFLTVAEIAEITRLSRMTVYRLVRSGEIPGTRVGRSFRIRADAVAAYLGLDTDPAARP